METSEAFRGLECAETGERYGPHDWRDAAAPGPLDPAYDYDAVSLDPAALSGRGLARFADLLPFVEPVSLVEGGTPLVEAPALADELDVERAVIQDESRNPTGTFLDRGMALSVTAAEAAGAETVALASPGNSGQSAAAYAGRADLRSYAFVPSRTAFSNKAMTNVHGGEMRVVGGRYGDALTALHDDLQSEWHSLQEFDNPYRHEGAKTVAYELAESLGWTVPDAVVVPASTGELVVGVVKGFRELRAVGLVDELPPVYAVQSAGCAPIATAWERELDDPEVWTTPDTISGELEIPDPPGGALALDALAESGGGALTVEDADILESAAIVARRVGVEMGVAGGAAAAGAWELGDDLPPEATVALLNTESGAKTADILRSHLMGQGV